MRRRKRGREGIERGPYCTKTRGPYCTWIQIENVHRTILGGAVPQNCRAIRRLCGASMSRQGRVWVLVRHESSDNT